jgi:hypothetical protein
LQKSKSFKRLKEQMQIAAIATLLVDFMPKISVQGILVKARLSIEKKIVTVDLTDEQKANTVGESLEVNANI